MSAINNEGLQRKKTIKQEVNKTNRSQIRAICLTLIFAWLCCLYAYSLLGQGGRVYISPDGRHYLAMASGGPAASPFNTRVLKPYLAGLLAAALHIAGNSAFQILTTIEVFASLFLLLILLNRNKASLHLQLAMMLSFGVILCASFGRAPVLVDTMLVLWICLFIYLLELGKFWAGLLIALLAVLTKEYGIALALVLSVLAYRRERRVFALLALLLPAAVLVINKYLYRSSPLDAGFLSLLGGATKSTINQLRNETGGKILFYWFWGAVVPLLLVAALYLCVALKRRVRLNDHYTALAVMLIFTPGLLTGDWDRSLLVLLPFAFVALADHPLANDWWFATLIAVGVSTSVISRMAIGIVGFPVWIKALLLTAGLLTMVLALLQIGWFYFFPGVSRRVAMPMWAAK
jgi:hypothetical protein